MNRRKFFRYTGFTALAGVIAAGGFYATLPGRAGLIVRVLKEDLSKLRVNPEDMTRYAEEAARLNVFRFDETKWKFLEIYTRLIPLGIPLPRMYKYKQFRADITGNFLLSTDYFWSKKRDDELIQYSGRIYTPYQYPCGNPFSSLFFPDVA